MYLGRSAAQGVGCDDTSGPSTELRPLLEVIPADEQAAVAQYPWLGYLGHWGEEHRSIYDGPTGPNTNTKWKTPITWSETSWRASSFDVPAGHALGLSATDFFCGAVASGSRLLTAFEDAPGPVLLVLAALSALVIWLASRTRWHAAPFRLRRRRPWGSLVASSLRLYLHHPRLFLGIGLLFVPLGLAITLLQYLVFQIGPLHPLVSSAGSSNAVVDVLAFTLGLFVTIIGLAVVQAVTAIAVVELDAGRSIGPGAAYRWPTPACDPCSRRWSPPRRSSPCAS